MSPIKNPAMASNRLQIAVKRLTCCNILGSGFPSSSVILLGGGAVRVNGGMSLRNGMWKDVRNGIIMQNNNCGMT